MGIWDRLRKGRRERTDAARPLTNEAFADHLQDFVDTRWGVEAWVEEAQKFARPSILLVAFDGEFTRRQVPSETWAYRWAEARGIPAHRAGVVPYPQRMRDHIAREKARRRRQ